MYFSTELPYKIQQDVAGEGVHWDASTRMDAKGSKHFYGTVASTRLKKFIWARKYLRNYKQKDQKLQ